MPSGAERRTPRSPPPWQFLCRAAAVVMGLVLLLLADARGATFYLAWSLIVLALASEAAAAYLYRRRSGRG